MPTSDKNDIDPLAELDDDLGEDWESAFQSEDFMFTPDEEANDFFLFDENDSEEDINDLTAIMDNAEKEVIHEQQQADKESLEATAESSDPTEAPPKGNLAQHILQKVAAGYSFFKSRPLYQRAIATTVPCLVLLFIMATFFLRSTSEELAQTNETEIIIADVQVGPEKKVEPIVEIVAPKPVPPPTVAEEPVRVKKERTIRKQWDFPTFTIVSRSKNAETLFVNVNLSLIAILPAGAALPEEKNVFVKDIIYQFYQNRSPQELKRFALARGEMIHKLHNWLQKEWPESPVNTVIFSKYQVVRAPQSS